MPFYALEVAFDLIRGLGEPMKKIRAHNPNLADQIDRSSSSVAQNLAEGRRRAGRDRIHLWRIAAGSADETMVSVRIAEARGYVELAEVAKAIATCDRLLGMTWRLTH
jgi:four helix bundle protein